MSGDTLCYDTLLRVSIWQFQSAPPTAAVSDWVGQWLVRIAGGGSWEGCGLHSAGSGAAWALWVGIRDRNGVCCVTFREFLAKNCHTLAMFVRDKCMEMLACPGTAPTGHLVTIGRRTRVSKNFLRATGECSAHPVGYSAPRLALLDLFAQQVPMHAHSTSDGQTRCCGTPVSTGIYFGHHTRPARPDCASP